MPETLRLLIFGAHPDDAEYAAGGLASIYRQHGHEVRMISLTNGQAGHFERPPAALAELRRREAAAAGQIIGATYITWDFPDGELVPNLEARRRGSFAKSREFRPDLVLTHRPCDYHPDHRAVGQLVQDATYLVTVPNVLRETPPLDRDPVVAYMPDLFTKPYPMTAEIVLDATAQIDTVVAMLACHRSQVFEWLPYEGGVLDQVPADDSEKPAWLKAWYLRQMRPLAHRFRQDLIAAYGENRGRQIEFCEVYELSEYAASAGLCGDNSSFPTPFVVPPRR